VIRPADPVTVAVQRVLARPEDAAAREGALKATQGMEVQYFARLLAQGGRLADPLGDALSEAAEAAVAAKPAEGAKAVVLEISNQACCARRPLLAASLRGLVRGLGRAETRVVDEEAAHRLEALAVSSDQELAEAAATAWVLFQP
jgi:thioredoxin-like negative regulator of GroEL